MRQWWLVVGLVPTLTACTRMEAAAPALVIPSPAPGPGGSALASPVAAPRVPVQVAGAPLVPGTRAYRSDWRGVPAGQAPPEFIDVQRDGHQRSWLYDGGWRVSHGGGEALLEVPFALTEPREPLTFRRYAGSAFGPDGALPTRYRVEAEARSLGGSLRFAGYGELAIQAFYLDPENYVEVLQTDQALLLWQAQDAPPMQGRGWKQLGRLAHPVKVGTWIRLGAEVDRASGEFVGLLDGRVVLRARPSLLKPDAPARLTIRATGNKEEWRSLEIIELPPAP